MAWPETVILRSNCCTLELLSHAHLDQLVNATKDGELWNIHYARVPSPDDMHHEITRRLQEHENGSMLPFAVIDNKTQLAIGMTTYCRTDSVNKRLGIGWTWYAKSYQQTALNTSCKLILLTHAFEQLNCIAVEFRVDVLNQPSQKAVARLGARFDGIIRNHSILPNGIIQDMRLYSVLPHEWPTIKQHLRWLLEKYG